MPDVVEEFLSNYPEQIRTISRELRKMTKRAIPAAHEFLYYNAISYSLSDSALDSIWRILPMQKHVVLGFFYGARLNDPHHLLQGTGKRARHVNIKTLEGARNPALKDLVKAAWSDGPDAITTAKQQMRQRRARRKHRNTTRTCAKRTSRSRRRRR